MLSLKIKDIKNRNRFFKVELQKRALKFVLINLSTKNFSYNSKIVKFNTKSYNISKTKLVRRCVLNNKSKAVRLFGLSRSVFRDMLSSGIFPGFKKAVW